MGVVVIDYHKKSKFCSSIFLINIIIVLKGCTQNTDSV